MTPYQYTPINSHDLQIRVLHILPKRYAGPECASSSSSDGLSSRDFSGSLDHESSVSCTLHVVSLRDNPEYHALSYCWGDPDLPLVKILLDEIEVEVTISLNQALKSFRHESKTMVFWADAICINQNDPEEKAEQIKMMREIYSCATVVDVFLGPGTPGTDKAMEAVQDIGQAAYHAGVLSITVESMRDCGFYIRDDHEGYGFNRPKIDDPLAGVKRSLYQLAMDIGTKFPYTEWSEIGNREYWNRLWIMQEFCLGKELMITCGKWTIPFQHCFETAWIFLTMQAPMVLHTYGILQSAENPDGAVDPAVEPMLRYLVSYESSPTSTGPLIGARKQHRNFKPSTLMNLLERCCLKASKDLVRKATYPRDLIYGLLGMASDSGSLNIQPLYTNIKSVEETVQIFTSVTRVLLEHDNVDILTWCQHPRSLPNLPSWVPDFTSITLKPACETREAALFSASGQSSLSIAPDTASADPRLIGVRGARVDTVMDHGSMYTVEDTSRIIMRSTQEWLQVFATTTQYLEEIKALCEKAQLICSSNSTSSSLSESKWSEAYWRIPCADQADKSTFRTRATSASLQGYEDIRRSMEIYIKMATNLTQYHHNSKALEAYSAEHIACIQSAAYASYKNAMAYQTNRKPFISSRGYVGLIPAHSLPGDVVIIIFGAVQPFVVRRVGVDRWELIGEAYVYGIMDGEFMESESQAEEFILC